MKEIDNLTKDVLIENDESIRGYILNEKIN